MGPRPEWTEPMQRVLERTLSGECMKLIAERHPHARSSEFLRHLGSQCRLSFACAPANLPLFWTVQGPLTFLCLFWQRVPASRSAGGDGRFAIKQLEPVHSRVEVRPLALMSAFLSHLICSLSWARSMTQIWNIEGASGTNASVEFYTSTSS